jgi:RNA recognition motif-containing protein
MSTRIHIGNLGTAVTTSELAQVFARFGLVESISIAGYERALQQRCAFVEMRDETEALAAIASLNGILIQGRLITVHVARPREKRLPTSGLGDGRSRGSSGRFGARAGNHGAPDVQ